MCCNWSISYQDINVEQEIMCSWSLRVLVLHYHKQSHCLFIPRRKKLWLNEDNQNKQLQPIEGIGVINNWFSRLDMGAMTGWRTYKHSTFIYYNKNLNNYIGRFAMRYGESTIMCKSAWWQLLTPTSAPGISTLWSLYLTLLRGTNLSVLVTIESAAG